MILRFVIAVLLLAISMINVFADDNPETPYPIEEQCVVDIVQDYDNPSYSGILLMSGYAGIHAVQADWETPRILASFYIDALGEPINGGQLSPDQKWYAVPVGRIEIERSWNRYWYNEGLRVYSLTDDTTYKFNFNDYTDELDYQVFHCCVWTFDMVQWVSNDVIVTGGLQIQLSTQDVTLAPFVVGKPDWAEQVFSPDMERVFSTYSGSRIYNPYEPEDEELPIELIDGVSWQRDSTAFIIEHRVSPSERDTADYLSLYDRDGNFIETVFDVEVGILNLGRPFSGRSELAWSFDNRYFAFNYKESYSSETELYLLDMENQTAINTCLSPVSELVWSPDMMQVAMLLDSPNILRVAILDIETLTLHEVARHSRDTNFIGTENVLKPDIIGWRESE